MLLWGFSHYSRGDSITQVADEICHYLFTLYPGCYFPLAKIDLFILPLPGFGQQKAVTHRVCNGFFMRAATGDIPGAETGEITESRSNLITKRRILNGVYD